MKVEAPFIFNPYDYILITDLAQNPLQPWQDALYLCLSGAVPWYDYINYYVTASGTSGDTYETTLNGSDNTVSGITLHVPNLSTTQTQGILSALVQYYLMVDKLDVQLQVSVHGTNLYQLTKDQTQLTSATSPVNGYLQLPQYAYGTDIIPQVTVTNTNTVATVASTEANQGIMIWGNRYQIKQVVDPRTPAQVQAGMPDPREKIFTDRRFTAITVVPPRF